MESIATSRVGATMASTMPRARSRRQDGARVAADPHGAGVDLGRRLFAGDQHGGARRAPTPASAWRTNVLLPIPGSPPTSTSEPGTTPPPRTRSSSGMPLVKRSSADEVKLESGRTAVRRRAENDGGAGGLPPLPPLRFDDLFGERVPGAAIGAAPGPARFVGPHWPQVKTTSSLRGTLADGPGLAFARDFSREDSPSPAAAAVSSTGGGPMKGSSMPSSDRSSIGEPISSPLAVSTVSSSRRSILMTVPGSSLRSSSTSASCLRCSAGWRAATDAPSVGS